MAQEAIEICIGHPRERGEGILAEEGVLEHNPGFPATPDDPDQSTITSPSKFQSESRIKAAGLPIAMCQYMIGMESPWRQSFTRRTSDPGSPTPTDRSRTGTKRRNNPGPNVP